MLEVGTWEDVECLVSSQPLGVVVRIPKRWLAHPTHHGLARIFGFSEGQVADYHKPLPDGGRLYVREFQQWYEIHREEQFPYFALSPAPPPADPAHAMSGAAALGALLGSMLGESPRAAVAGAAIGGLVAAALLAGQRPTPQFR